MSTPLDKENLRPKFLQIMKQNQLKPEEVAANRAKRDIFSTGAFECLCGRTWQSAFSWITFDLSKLEIVKRWKMLCQNCHGECYPKFAVEQLEEMFEKAVSIYLGPKSDYAINIGYGARRKFNQPHRPDLCEKCGYVSPGAGYYCWSFIFYTR